MAEARIILFRAGELGPCLRDLTFSRKQLRLNIMSFPAGGVIAQDLIHHLLGLVQVTC